MRNLIKSSLRFSWAMSLFGIQQFENVIEDATRQDNKATTALDSIAEATERQLGGIVGNTFRAGDQLQSGMVDMMFGGLSTGGSQSPPRTNPGSATSPSATASRVGSQPRSGNSVNSTPYPVHSGRLNMSCFIVLGEGLAAGMGDFTLADETQSDSFPAQMAQQMQTEFPQPLIQSPGICSPVGFAELPVVVSVPMQTTVLDRLPPKPVNNLSVPGFKLCDTLRLRPAQPLIQRHNAKQTAANLILGMIPIAYGEGGQLPTQLECVIKRNPTFTLVELGYHEALEAAVKAKIDLLPDAESFRSDYTQLLTCLKRACAEVLVLTIPDPFDTAHFSPVSVAAKILRIEPGILLNAYHLNSDDFITANGLKEIGFQLFAGTISPLPDGCVIGAEVSAQICRRIHELNGVLITLAQEQGAFVYDLHYLFRRVKDSGVAVGQRRLTSEYLGGFYSLNGYYPGATGHALIANELLHYLNTIYGSDFPQIDLQTVMQNDPVAAYRQAEGQEWSASQLSQTVLPSQQVTYGASRTATIGEARTPRVKHKQAASGWNPLPQPRDVPKPLQLPAGLEQVLPLSKAASYFGDSIRVVNCQDADEARFGSCRASLFGGFAMVDSHLSGSVRIKFSQPVNRVTHFEVTHGEGLVGDDGVLSAPQFFKLPALRNRVQDIPGLVSSGDLNLDTGEVSNLTYYISFSNTALLALTRVNPNLPAQPIVFSSLPSTETRYGSAWAMFEQRPDGLLDYTFYGSAFLPLGSDFQGQPVQFPLPICSSTLQFASVPAKGTALHPHLSISTRESEVTEQDVGPDIPFNTIQELTLFTHNSSFGDAFTLNAPETLGGNTTGRSHVLGRALIQFGERSGNSAPVAVSLLNAGGVMAPMASSPISQAFPGRLYPGPHGFDEFLRFPLRTFSLDDLQILDDPFDISVGAVDLRTGRFLNQLLHRGFISQDLFFALVRVEPRTPGSSFFFRGPTALERGQNGELIFRFQGQVHIPYPEGFLFPNPSLATGFAVGGDSALDPFLWIHAIQDADGKQAFKQGGERNVIASTGERFSYSYKIPSDLASRPISFEYENHTQQGKFQMHSLAWLGFGNSGGSGRTSGEYDTVTFTGFGIWSKDGSHTVQQATVQISTSAQRPYVGIQIDLGNISNVNTKPPKIDDARP
ncbi:MAG TPA: hypothetical protein VKA78_02535 [Pyrinomonadaceae bacterium]|nr:hypothetical protein [Pyrinomonadaceae bacterium]